MCYPKPGPRCSSHARARLTAAQNTYNTATAANDDDAAAEARHDLIVAAREYQATPDGMADLENNIEAVSSQPTPDIGLLTRLNEALLQGRATRRSQMAAYRATMNPVEEMSDKELRAELRDLVATRLPAAADDPDALAAEQARMNAIVDLMDARATESQPADVSPVAGPVAPVATLRPAPRAVEAPALDEASPFGPAATAPAATVAPTPDTVQAPRIPTTPRAVGVLMPGDEITVPGSPMPHRITERRNVDREGATFVELVIHDPYTRESRTRYYDPASTFPVVTTQHRLPTAV